LEPSTTLQWSGEVRFVDELRIHAEIHSGWKKGLAGARFSIDRVARQWMGAFHGGPNYFDDVVDSGHCWQQDNRNYPLLSKARELKFVGENLTHAERLVGWLS
jgi:hypothetical protein